MPSKKPRRRKFISEIKNNLVKNVPKFFATREQALEYIGDWEDGEMLDTTNPVQHGVFEMCDTVAQELDKYEEPE